ncbi:ComF family protein [Sphingobacterium alimentarium]|uniref:ComF family protein n=1 Tax=Sphingobacterium alimentarium TaxID=797292 RepID=A0A4R3VWN7_9SPHI|nr:phosphoribosyltransferase family protein [Sphingobacterium alimentarium]TCV11858.1 ComF family protein [Sphingobacterium alimentarium]
MLHLAKSSRVESLLHSLKYKNQPEIGHFLGRRYAQSIKEVLQDVDMIVPIPIHPSKLRKRGYNQAAEFAKGLSEGLEIPVNTTLIIRKVLSVSQTEKSRNERYDNVAEVFSLLPYISDLKDVHILLVDDVLTTGATIAEADNLFVEAGAKVSIVTIARA